MRTTIRLSFPLFSHLAIAGCAERFVPGGANAELDDLMHATVARHIDAELDGDESVVTIAGTAWDGHQGGRGASMILSSGGQAQVSYLAVSGDGDTWLVFEASENGDGTDIAC